jgi:Xaa-Pro aminopeptidase
MKRIEKLQNSLQGYAVEALLITNPIDLKYLLGISLSAGTLVVLQNEAFLFVDGRYFETCQNTLPIQVQKIAAGAIKVVLESVRFCGFVADTTTYSEYLQLKQELGSFCELVALFKPVEQLRASKDEQEIACIKKSCQLAMEGF